jgi:hypothetical protein
VQSHPTHGNDGPVRIEKEEEEWHVRHSSGMLGMVVAC